MPSIPRCATHWFSFIRRSKRSSSPTIRCASSTRLPVPPPAPACSSNPRTARMSGARWAWTTTSSKPAFRHSWTAWNTRCCGSDFDRKRDKAMKPLASLLTVLAALVTTNTAAASEWVVYEGKSGPGKGKHIVFLSGDEEYRGEEGLPQLAKILALRHGFKCTVLFSINPKTGEIDPNTTNNEPGIEALDSADLCVMALRFRAWPDPQMKHFVDYYLAGKPIIALRTSTHAFAYGSENKSAYAK